MLDLPRRVWAEIHHKDKVLSISEAQHLPEAKFTDGKFTFHFGNPIMCHKGEVYEVVCKAGDAPPATWGDKESEIVL